MTDDMSLEHRVSIVKKIFGHLDEVRDLMPRHPVIEHHLMQVESAASNAYLTPEEQVTLDDGLDYRAAFDDIIRDI